MVPHLSRIIPRTLKADRGQTSRAALLASYESREADGTGDRTRQSYREELIGDGLWWDTCAELAWHDPDLLRDRVSRPAGAPTWAIDVIDGADDGDVMDPTRLGGTARRALHVARLALTVRAAASETPPQSALLASMVEDWAAASVLLGGVPDGDFARRPVPDPVREVFTLLNSLPGGQARAAVALQAMLLASAIPGRRRRCSLGVLFTQHNAGETQGVSGTLEIEELSDGPPGLFPDPRTMGPVTADEAFTAALESAWKCAIGDRPRPPCLLWRLEIDGGWGLRIVGGSLGAAYAALLVEVAGPPPWGRSRPVRTLTRTAWRLRRWPRGLVKRRAITGAVSAVGKLLRVDGMPQKLEAARRADLRLVAPKPNREEVTKAAEGTHVTWAADVGQARKQLYKFKTLRTVILVALPVLLGSLGVPMFTVFRDGAEQERANRQIEQLIQDSKSLRSEDPAHALRLAVTADRIASTSTTQTNLVETLLKTRYLGDLARAARPPFFLGFADHGRILVTGTGRQVTLWELKSRRILATVPIRSGKGQPEFAVNPARSLLAVGHQSGNVELWNLQDPAKPARLGELPHSTLGAELEFSTNGRLLVTANRSPQVVLWDMSRPGHPRRLSVVSAQLYAFTHYDVTSVAISADSRTLAIAGFSANSFDISQPERPILRGSLMHGAQPNHIRDLAPAPAGKKIYLALTKTGTDPGRVAEWDLSNPQATRVEDRLGGWEEIEISPSGVLASVDHDGSVVLSDPHSDFKTRLRPTSQRLTTGTASAQPGSKRPPAMAFSPDGSTLAVHGPDGRITFWDVGDLNPANRVTKIGASSDLRIALGGRIMAIDGYVNPDDPEDDRRELAIYDISVPGRYTRRTKIPLPAESGATALSSDATTMMINLGDGSIARWDLSKPGRPKQLSPIQADPAQLEAYAISADGKAVVSAGPGHGVILWNLSNHLRPVRDAVLVRPDAYRAQTWKNSRAADGFGSRVRCGPWVSFGPDNRTMIIGGVGRQIALWSLQNARPPVQVSKIPVQDCEEGAHAVQTQGAMSLISGRWRWTFVDPSTPRRTVAPALPAGHRLVGLFSLGTAGKFGAADELAVTTATGHTMVIWYLRDGIDPIQVGSADHAIEPSVSYVPDGRIFLSSSVETKVADLRRVIEIVHDPRSIACRTVGEGLSRTEWDSRAPDHPYREICR